MEIIRYTPGKIPMDVHLDVCDFLYGNNPDDFQRHLQYVDRTTFFVVRKENKIVGTVKCMWKENEKLPIEEAFIQNEKIRIKNQPAVEIGGFKIDESLPLVDRMRVIDRLFKIVREETVGYYLYLTCDPKMENFYQRKLDFAPIGQITFDTQAQFVAMMIKNEGKVIVLPSYLFPVIVELAKRDLLDWACEGLKAFMEIVTKASVDDQRSYSQSFEAIRHTWYDHIHDRLNEHNFVNGKPAENTWDKRPKACFWWEVYKSYPEHYRPYYDHHCSSKCRQEQMLNFLNDFINSLEA